MSSVSSSTKESQSTSHSSGEVSVDEFFGTTLTFDASLLPSEPVATNLQRNFRVSCDERGQYAYRHVNRCVCVCIMLYLCVQTFALFVCGLKRLKRVLYRSQSLRRRHHAATRSAARQKARDQGRLWRARENARERTPATTARA